MKGYFRNKNYFVGLFWYFDSAILLPLDESVIIYYSSVHSYLYFFRSIYTKIVFATKENTFLENIFIKNKLISHLFFKFG